MAFVFLVSIILSSFFSPAWLTTRPEYFIVITGLLFYITKIKRTVGLFKLEIFILILLTLSAGISLLGQIFSGVKLVGSDLMIIWRYLYYIALLVFGGIVSKSFKANFLAKIFFFTLPLTLIFISFAQYYNFMGINSILVPVYTSSGAAKSLLQGEFWRRVTGTYGNPNYWGFAMGVISVTSFYLLYFNKKIISLIFLVLSIVSVVFTGSRAALLSSLSSIFLVTLFILYQEKKLSKALVFCLVTTISGGLVYFVFTNLIEYENKGRFDTSNVATLDSRIEYWMQILDAIQQSTVRIFIGYGTSKTMSIQYGDNMYIRMFRDFGLIGLFSYLSFLTVFIRNIATLSKKKIFEARLMLYIISMYLIFDLTADCWFEVRIICLLLIFYAYIKTKYSDMYKIKLTR